MSPLQIIRPGAKLTTQAKIAHQKPATCFGCPLHERGTGFVPAEGPSPAAITLVGEAPGFDEATVGRPFIGAAGSMLTRLLRMAGIDRESVRIANAINCFPGDTLVRARGVREAYKRAYSGEVVTLTTGEGDLTCTPNHPVLSQKGWVAAGSLTEGDYLIRGDFGEGMRGGDPDVHDAPLEFQQAFDALQDHGRRQRMVGRNVDFHGDGRDADVEVVAFHGLLWDQLDRSVLQHRDEGVLEASDHRAPFVAPYRLSAATLFDVRTAALAAAGFVVRGFDRERSRFYSQPFPVESSGVTARAQRDPDPEERLAQAPLPYPVLDDERLNPFPRFVALAKILKVERHSVTMAHVYNLQTVSEEYIANGFIVHNCAPPKLWFDARAPWYHGALQHCRQYTQPEIEQASVIVPMGATAIRRVLGVSGKHTGPEAFHGTVSRLLLGQWVVPTFHPSYLQRGASNLIGTVVWDLQRALEVATQGWTPEPITLIEDPPIDWFKSWVDQLCWAIEADPYGVWCTVDIETPDTKGKDEHELGEDDQSYQIERVNFASHPDEGITVPYVGAYIAEIDRVLRALQVAVMANCPTPDQRVLTADLRWVPAGDLKVGDTLVGFDEEPRQRTQGKRHVRRMYRTATVTYAKRLRAPVYQVTFSDGSSVKVTGEHKWLTRSGAGKGRHIERAYTWVATTDLVPGRRIRRLLPTWDIDTSYESGYLAGFYDGEGSLCHRPALQLQVAQKSGPIIEAVKAMLDERGFRPTKQIASRAGQRKQYDPIEHVTLNGGKTSAARFLGSIRPKRLLAKFRPEMLRAAWAFNGDWLEVTEVRRLGVREIVGLSTDCHTYLLEGFGAHNCDYDKPRLRAAGHPIPPIVHDTMWMWKMLQSDLPGALGFYAPFYSKFLLDGQWGAWKHLSGTRPVTYAAIDGPQELRAAFGMARDLIAGGQWEAYERHQRRLDQYVLKPCSEVGVPVDRPRLEAFRQDLTTKARRLLQALQGEVPETLRPLTPKDGLTRPPHDGAVHTKGRATTTKGKPKKDAPDALKQDLYAQSAVVVEKLVFRTIRVCTSCGAQEVQQRHRCADKTLTPAVVLAEATVKRWFWQEPFNPDSPQQILAWLKHHKHPVGKSKTSDESTDKKTLEANLAKTGHPFYRALLDYRAIKKVLSTYVEGTLRRLDAEDRLHPHFTFKPSTQRLSATAPNIQNVVADRGGKEALASGFRKSIVARDEEPEPTPEFLQRWGTA